METSSKDDAEFYSSLREVKVFVTFHAIYGIPTPLCLGIVIISAYIMAFMSFGLGFIFFTFLAVTFYLIHKDDQEALFVWLRSLSGVDTWRSGQPTKTETVIILEDQ